MKLPTKPNGRKWCDRYEKWLHRDLLLAGYSLAEDPQNLNGADSRSGEEILTQLVELEVQTDDRVGRKVREQVFQVLCSFSETDFQEQALELLKARSESIEEDRLRKYRVELGEKEVVIAELLQSLRDDDSFVRGSAAGTLGQWGKNSDAVCHQILEWLDRNSDSESIGHGIDALWDAMVNES
ncbi:MAG: HEAT repeat domain-containing protein [Limnospira sp.]